ncbi:phage head-tail adapter protein [Enterococcus sp. DIV0240a]|uniref:phage head-tail adapter protein n=1 Tax=unclassified Enterococcus TaxID=2608891 RepID=UPI003D26C2D2
MRKSSTRKLNTKVAFYKYKPNKGPSPGEEEKTLVYKTRAEIYDPSMKDLEVLNGVDSKQGLTMIIRDPRGKYLPKNKHLVEVFDYRYEGLRWNIVEVRNDLSVSRFITILLSVITDEE